MEQMNDEMSRRNEDNGSSTNYQDELKQTRDRLPSFKEGDETGVEAELLEIAWDGQIHLVKKFIISINIDHQNPMWRDEQLKQDSYVEEMPDLRYELGGMFAWNKRQVVLFDLERWSFLLFFTLDDSQSINFYSPDSLRLLHGNLYVAHVIRNDLSLHPYRQYDYEKLPEGVAASAERWEMFIKYAAVSAQNFPDDLTRPWDIQLPSRNDLH